MNTGMLPALLSAFFCVVDVSQKLKGHEPFYFSPCSSSVQEHHRFFLSWELWLSPYNSLNRKHEAYFFSFQVNKYLNPNFRTEVYISCDWKNCAIFLVREGCLQHPWAQAAGSSCLRAGLEPSAEGWALANVMETLISSLHFSALFFFFCHFRLCSFSLNFFSWCKNVSLVFLPSFSSVGLWDPCVGSAGRRERQWGLAWACSLGRGAKVRKGGPGSAAAKRGGLRLGPQGMSVGSGGSGWHTARETPRATSASSPGVQTAKQEFCYRRYKYVVFWE